jgi:hypothetical protein
VTYDRNELIKSVPYTEVPYVVENLYGGPASPSVLERVYAKVSFKVRSYFIIQFYCFNLYLINFGP